MTKPIIEPFLNNKSPLPRENRQRAVFIASIICKCLLVVKIGTIKRLDDVFFKLLFADGMGISVSCILDFEITEQNG